MLYFHLVRPQLNHQNLYFPIYYSYRVKNYQKVEHS
nr:MAG TPA: hypothetical protein [Caudoviricetes sp.]